MQKTRITAENPPFCRLHAAQFSRAYAFHKGLLQKHWMCSLEIPGCIFDNDNLSSLEAISKYLYENVLLNFHDIGMLLNRDERTIWNAYFFSRRKMPAALGIQDSKFFVPAALFQDRRYSVLEIISVYLKEVGGLKYVEIGRLLNRNQKTVWTVCQRARKKRLENG